MVKSNLQVKEHTTHDCFGEQMQVQCPVGGPHRKNRGGHTLQRLKTQFSYILEGSAPTSPQWELLQYLKGH